jgi:Tol biopolymer transport system component
MIDTEGGNARQFTYSEKDESSAVFSADGKWVAFISSRDGGANLYVMPTTSGEAQQLTHISTGVSDPLWVSERKMDRLFERRIS